MTPGMAVPCPEKCQAPALPATKPYIPPARSVCSLPGSSHPRRYPELHAATLIQGVNEKANSSSGEPALSPVGSWLQLSLAGSSPGFAALQRPELIDSQALRLLIANKCEASPASPPGFLRGVNEAEPS